MKKIITRSLKLSLLLMLFSFCLATAPRYYKIKVIGLSTEADAGKAEERLKKFEGFTFLKITLSDNYVYIKAEERVEFDAIKQDFEKAGLKIEKSEIIQDENVINNLLTY
jgi:copper chaperone CopZ